MYLKKTIEDIRRYAYLFNCFCSMIHLLTNHRMQVRREEEGVRISELVVVVGLALCDNTEVEAGPANTNTPTRASSLPSLPLTQHKWLRTVLVRNFGEKIHIFHSEVK